MNAEQKKIALECIRLWGSEDLSDCAGDQMAALLQELVDAPTPEPFGYFKAEPFGWTDCAETDDGAIALFAAPPAPSVPELEEYDAGFLNDFGGGNVGWWQDYIRAELGRAYEFYCSQLSAAQTPAEPPTDVARDVRLQVESEFAALLPGVTYMDEPDGGTPTVQEQIKRMAQDAARYRYLRNDCAGFDIAVAELDDDGHESWVHGYPPDELDAAIDAARSEKGGKA